MLDDLLDKYRRILSGRAIRNHLRVYSDDTFIVSYPRSGNTWIRFLVGTAVSNQKVDWNNFEEIIPDIYRNSYKKLQKLERPRILKSHHSYDKRYPKVIYVVRDVRDVFISYYNFHNKFKRVNNDLSLDEFLQKFIKGELDDFGTWSSNIRSWMSKMDEIEGGLHLVKYEDIVRDPARELQGILEFLNISRSQKEIDQAIEWTSFSNMRQLENDQQDAALFKNSNKGLKFTNQGKVGNWTKVLSKEQIMLLETEYADLLSEFNY